ncbi:MAG: hypothetical protein AB1428_06715 [Bacteroidota bacterium]
MVGRANIIMVLGFAIVLAYVTMNLNRYSTSAVGNMSSYYEATAAHSLALAGANAGLAKIYQDTTWDGSMSETLDDPVMPGSFSTELIDLGGFRKMLRSVSSYSSSAAGVLHDTIDVYFNTRRKNSYTLYAWLTNNTGNVFWSDGDTVWGRAHSNGNVHISGSPVFMDKVTTSKRFDPPFVGKGTNQAIFKNGYETGIASVELPSDLSELVAASTSGGRRYTDDIDVTLLPGTLVNNDGIALVQDLSTGAIDTISLSGGSFNGVIVGNGKVSVAGVLDGSLSIASLQSVSVKNDITYERNPRYGTSDDLLGLIAETDIVIADNAANRSNCEVQGCLFARTGSLKAENLSSLPVCGTLNTFGSIIQNTEQEVGLYTAKGSGKPTLTNGFAKDFRYDLRLADNNVRPPYFPGYYVKAYAISNWWESYRISSYD